MRVPPPRVGEKCRGGGTCTQCLPSNQIKIKGLEGAWSFFLRFPQFSREGTYPPNFPGRRRPFPPPYKQPLVPWYSILLDNNLTSIIQSIYVVSWMWLYWRPVTPYCRDLQIISTFYKFFHLYIKFRRFSVDSCNKILPSPNFS